MLKAFFWLLVTFFLSLLVLGGIGFWKLFTISLWVFATSLSVFGLLVVVLIVLGICIVMKAKKDINTLLQKIDEFAKKVIAYFENLTKRPAELVKVILKIFKKKKK